MRKLGIGLLVPALVVLSGITLTGCNTSPEGGGTGENTFKVQAPTLTTTIKQGDTDTVKLTVKRGRDFKQTVKLTATDPEGISSTFEPDVVKGTGDEDVNLRIKVAKDAPVGERRITIKGAPEKGDSTTVDVKVNVKKLD